MPRPDDQFLFIMICLTGHKKRFENYARQKSTLPELAICNAITPSDSDFDQKCSMVNFRHDFTGRGSKGLWLSNLEVFAYFLKSTHTYLVVLEDDAIIPGGLRSSLLTQHVVHPKFLALGGTRLGQYASCNLYNKACVKNILSAIRSHPIDRNADHYFSNVCCPGYMREVPYNVMGLEGLGIPAIAKVDQEISKESMRSQHDE